MHEKIGKLQCLKRPGENDDASVVLLHGFGADAGDLFSLADYLDPEREWNFIFPEAMLEVPIGPMNSGRAWFPLTQRDLEGHVDFPSVRPPGLDLAAAVVYDMLFDLNAKKLILGGFSQGAMVATEVALENPGDVHGLLLLSGTLLDQKKWRAKAPDLAGKPFLQSHGVQDPVLPYTMAQQLFEVLKAGGMDGSFVSFGGGHEIPLPVLQKAKAFIAKIGAV